MKFGKGIVANMLNRREKEMRLPKFEYLQPTSLDEALDFLERIQREAKLIAGEQIF